MTKFKLTNNTYTFNPLISMQRQIRRIYNVRSVTKLNCHSHKTRKKIQNVIS